MVLELCCDVQSNKFTIIHLHRCKYSSQQAPLGSLSEVHTNLIVNHYAKNLSFMYISYGTNIVLYWDKFQILSAVRYSFYNAFFSFLKNPFQGSRNALIFPYNMSQALISTWVGTFFVCTNCYLYYSFHVAFRLKHHFKLEFRCQDSIIYN